MQNLFARINILQIVVLSAIFAIMSGVLPLAGGVSANDTITKLTLVFSLVTVVNAVNTKRVIDALSEVPFKNEQLNQLFDMLKLYLGSTETAQMGSVVTTTTVTPSAPVGVAATDGDLSSRG